MAPRVIVAVTVAFILPARALRPAWRLTTADIFVVTAAVPPVVVVTAVPVIPATSIVLTAPRTVAPTVIVVVTPP
jgi:hypothetical protein